MWMEFCNAFSYSLKHFYWDNTRSNMPVLTLKLSLSWISHTICYPTNLYADLRTSYGSIGHMRCVIIAYCIVFFLVLFSFCLRFVYKFFTNFLPLWQASFPWLCACLPLSSLICTSCSQGERWSALCSQALSIIVLAALACYKQDTYLTQIGFDRVTGRRTELWDSLCGLSIPCTSCSQGERWSALL